MQNIYPIKQINLGLEVWQKVFASPLYQQTLTLLKQIFKKNIVVADFDAMGITLEEWKHIRGPSEHISFPFCDLILETEKGRQQCVELSKQAFSQLSTTLKTDICICHAGLTEVSIPIIIDGKYCGCISPFGGFLLHEPNEIEWQQIAEQTKKTGVDLERLKKAYFGIPPISKELLGILVKLLNAFVEEIVKTAIEIWEYKKRITELEKALYEKYQFANIIGKSKTIQEVYKLLDKAITADYPVVIQGETGTGKELVAKALHFNGPRKAKPFISENCAAFASGVLESELFGHIKGSFTGADKDKKGLFELADGGTLFLDEVSIMDQEMQKKLLRALQECEIRPVGGKNTIKVNVRVISATNQNLKHLVQKGTFRDDLYYRLNVITINLPPLRERQEDIPLLVNHFLDKVAQETKTKRKTLSEEVMRLFLDNNWPGNVRELENEIKRCCVLTGEADLITPEVVSPHLHQVIKEDTPNEAEENKSLKEQIEEVERKCIIKALQKSGHKKTLCAKILGLHRNDVARKMKKLGIE
ncbi:MAG: sigma 54-interacting transcriptional regulator [Planctomycetota bacterium]